MSFALGSVVFGAFFPIAINADYEAPNVISEGGVEIKRFQFCNLDKSSYRVAKSIKMLITAYSSSVDETDNTPNITANGSKVYDGVVANNYLPFGAKIRMPELYGEKVFTVEDRMHKRKGKYQVDIWMASKKEAKNFGAKLTNIEILES